VRVRIAPSGKVLVVGDANGHAYVMDLPMLRRIAVVPIDGWCYGVGFSSDGKSCYFGGSRGELSSWDVGQWQTPRESGEKTAFVYALTVSSDGQTVVTVEPTVPGHTGGRIHFWSARPLKRLHTIETPAGVLSAAFSPDDKMLATGDEKGGLTLWEVATRNRLGVLPGHTAEVPGIAFTPDGRRLLSGSFDRTVRLWDVADRRELLRFSTHRGAVREVTVSHDGRWGASAGDDELIKCWDLQQGTEATTYSRHPRGATSLAFLPDDSAIVSCGDSGGVSIWPLRGNDTPSYKLHGVAGLSSVSICPDRFTALSAGADGVVNQFDLSNGRVLRSVTLPRQPSCVVVSPDQRTALVGGVEGMLQVLDLKNFTLRPVDVPTLAPPVAPLMPGAAPATSPTSRPSRPRDYVQAIAFAPLGELAFAGGWDSGGLLELKMPGGSPSWARSTDNRVLAAAFTPDGRRALVSIVRDLYLIDVANAHVIKVTHTTARPILCVAIAPDGKTAATGGYDHPIKLWDPQDVRYMNFMAGHLGPVRAVTFFPDSRTLASASEDNTVRLWDVETLNEVRSFTGHTGGTCALSVSRDGSILATSDRNGVVRTWDLNRETTYRAVARDLESCFAALDEKPDEPSMLKRIGEWFAFRGRNDWAADCFDRARAGGAMISPLIEARCDWELGRSDAALTALSQAEAQGTAPREYLELCTAAIRASGSSRPSSDGDRNRQQ
jgi:WD40 repeat protein